MPFNPFPSPSERRETFPASQPRPLPRYLTRQPMLDGEFRLLGHELAIRERTPVPVLPGARNQEENRDELLLVHVLDQHYRQNLGHKLTLVNLSPAALDSPLVDRLPQTSTVVALDRPISAESQMIRAMTLARDGCALALDEALLSPELAPLARDCRYLRVDVGDNDLAALHNRLVRVQGIRGPRLIARNVETEEAFDACRKLSFDLYQGYFFAHLSPPGGRGLDPGRLKVMEVLNLVSQRADFADIESRLKLDPALTYRLLRYINSPAVGLRYPIQNIGHALLMLGHGPLYRWLTLLLFTREGGDRRNQALLRNALVRANLAERLGEVRLGREAAGGLFVSGILSALDSLLGMPLEQAIAPLKLAPPIQEALLHQRGPYAPWLALALACENADATVLLHQAQALEMDDDTLNQAHLEALAWAEGMDL
ncbi:MAG: HDOD domain-containing protein [Pseudomonadota bacterium]